MAKVLRMTFTILHQTEVPDDFTDEEAKELVEEFAGEAGFLTLCNDIEWEVEDA